MVNKAIFWDFDGTLVWANESFKCSLIDAFKECKYEIDQNEIDQFLKSVCSWYTPQKDYVDGTKGKWWEELLSNVQIFCKKNQIETGDIQLICSIFKKNVINFEYTIYDDAEEILVYYQSKGYSNYIISNNFPELPDVIERMGLKRYFVDYFISANIGYEKPRMEIFKYAMQKADYPEVCYMIGDNPIADIQGGKKAGMNVVLVHNNSTNSLIDGYVCDELSNLKDIIKE